MTPEQNHRPVRTCHSTRLLSAAAAAILSACGGGGSSSDGSLGASIQTAPEPTARALAASDGTQQLALTPVTALASSIERGSLSADKAIDNDESSRWSSDATDSQFLTLDYGASVAIDRVRILWDNAHAKDYLLQVSDDNLAWTTFKTVSNSGGGLEDFDGFSVQGRYLRMQGVARSSRYGYSISEIKAFTGASASSPAPSPSPAPPPPVPSQPGVAIKPVAATSSATEGARKSADKAIDGDPTTNWSSQAEDGAWIQFDFGAKTALGYLKLVWGNSYGKEYSLQVSDDGSTWTSLRYVANGQGGTEEFLNLGVSPRFVRLQGISRATRYGYALNEAIFKSPGSDNSVAALTVSPTKVPKDGSGLVPLPSTAEPLEVLQFSLPDGTLVTRFGVIGRSRHARERGEGWNEIGYGPNETVDAAGNPVDDGPGHYLNFVPNYFKHRTWGYEIIDDSQVAGVTRPTLKINQYYQVPQKAGGRTFFRAFSRPEITGYGWMSPGEIVDRSLFGTQQADCAVVPMPPNGKLANPARLLNDGCSATVSSYPGHSAVSYDANGVLARSAEMPGATQFFDFSPEGLVPTANRQISDRPLKVGDVMELSTSFFSTPEAMAAFNDDGGLRYYTNEWVYVIGVGLRPWYGIQPRLFSWPLPADTLQGGLGSVSYDYADNATFIFQQPPNHVGMQNMQRFAEGRRLIHTNFYTGDHNEPGNDRYLPAVGLMGSHYNQSSCFACHANNGRSPAPTAFNERLDKMSVRTAMLDAKGQQMPDARYGVSLQMNARSVTGTPQDWGSGARVAGFDTKTVKLADGTPVELRKPRIAFDGPVPQLSSLRAAQPMIGVGLLEAVPEADILARVRATPDEDGVRGQANFVFDPESGATRLGRFGWKASKVSLRHQAASALLQDMSVTSTVYPNRDCLAGPSGCTTAKVERGISEADLQSITRYLGLVAVPAQRSLVSGYPKGVAPLDEHRVDPAQVSVGAKVFQTARCSACHTVDMKTGPGHLLAELRNQNIKPYTDLLLHDMGAGLADNLAEGKASGAQWRTAPLWGIGYTAKVQGDASKVGYLHDGRARNLTEAIMWHGGEAEKARQRFETLPATDREALLAFLRSL